ncbi:MAG: hypothetical protein B7X81_02950 [Hydrogenophilales bacterium 17-61-76]|nr:MAG: hypothetical protein B7X81_02950 [Hydrogenophilales bacterium 17-61-76]
MDTTGATDIKTAAACFCDGAKVATAVHDSASTNLNTPVKIDVKANDTASDGLPLLSQLVFSVLQLVDPSKGSVTENPDGTITFTPAANVTGDVVIEYALKSPCGATSNTAIVTVTIASEDCQITQGDYFAKTAPFPGNPMIVTCFYTTPERRVSRIENWSGGNLDFYALSVSIFDDSPAHAMRVNMHLNNYSNELYKERYTDPIGSEGRSFRPNIYGQFSGWWSQYIVWESYPSGQIKQHRFECKNYPSLHWELTRVYAETGNGFVDTEKSITQDQCPTYAQIDSIYPFDVNDSVIGRLRKHWGTTKNP